MDALRLNSVGRPGSDVNVSWLPLSMVVPRRVRWLWPGRVPLGKVTLLVGDPGQGKSLLTLDMAARVTRGAAWPDEAGASEERRVRSAECGGARAEGGTPRPVGRVVLLSAEDDASDTILPRVEAAGGEVRHVVLLRAFARLGRKGLLSFSLARDLAVLEAQVRELRDARLVVLDPVSAYFGGLDENRNTDVREAFARLAVMAERTGVAVVAVSHLSKRAAPSLLYRAIGSVAFPAASRSVWAVGPDRGEEGRLLFLSLKSNLVRRPTGLAYRIEPWEQNPAVPVVAWEADAVDMRAEEAFGAAAPRATRRDEAAAWLEGLLAAGPVASTEIERRAWEAGFSRRTLARGKHEAGVVASRVGAHQGAWFWRLPSQEAVSAVEETQGTSPMPLPTAQAPEPQGP